MKIYSQRDSKWASNLMGTGTLGQLGCTVTCLSMLSEISPDVLNNEIKSVGGYDGNYIIWEKLDSIKGFDFIKRVRVYDNADVSANLPCLVEVNGAPIGGTTHWVLYIGNQKLWDPWTGTEKATSSYLPIGYAVVKYNQLPEPCVITDQTKISKELLGWTEDLEIQQIRGLLSDFRKTQDEMVGLKLSVTALNASITDLRVKLDYALGNPPGNPQKLQTIHDILWGKDYFWVKLSKVKALLPK